MRRLAFALLALLLLRADMYPDASNSKLPQARGNLGVGRPVSIFDHGAKGDAITMPDGVMAQGSTTLTSVRANFTQADKGKKIQVDGAAGVSSPPLMTTIQTVTDAHTITLAAPAAKATPRRYLNGSNVVTPRVTGNYVPGDLLTLQGGTYTTPAVVKVMITKVMSTAITAAGSNGVNGSCRVQGTTGAGTLFQQDVTVSGGAITALGGLWGPSYYFTNPTNIAAEPITNAPGYNCVPAGATLNLTMGVHLTGVTTPGDYDPVAIPADPVATTPGSISGATGMTLNTGGVPWGNFVPTGRFVYGHDDSQALMDSIDAAAAIWGAGGQGYVFLPAGNYLIDAATTPMMYSGLGIVGEGTYRTNIILGANFDGDLFRWSEAWAGGGYQFSLVPPLVTNMTTGPRAVGFAVWGNRSSAHPQNILMFYDRNDQVFIDDVDIMYITGRCMQSGMKSPASPGEAYMRESIIGRMRCGESGQPGIPSIEWGTEGGGDSTDEIHINDINMFANHGDAWVMHNNNTSNDPFRNMRINKLRIEGLQSANPQGDHIRIGDPSKHGQITGIYFNQIELYTPYPNHAAFHTVGPADIYLIQVESGFIGSGMPMGKGLQLEAGRLMSFKMDSIYSWDTNVTIGPSVGGVFLDLNGAEQSLTYNAPNPWVLTTPARKVGLPSYTAGRDPATSAPILAPTFNDGTVRGGGNRGAGAVDWQMSRVTPDQVAGGQASVIGGGDSNKIGGGTYQGTIAGGTWNTMTGNINAIGGGGHNTASGYNTTIPGGAFGNDRGATGGMFVGGTGCQPFQVSGSCQRSWHVFGALPNAAAAVRLTSDGAAPASSGANCLPIPGGTSYQTVVRATARNWNANEHATWDAKQGMLVHKSGFPTQYIGDAGGAQSQSTAGPFGTLGIAADATNNCLALTYTPPAGNTGLINIVATVDVTEAQ